MTVLKRIGILSAAVFLMTGMTELGEHLFIQGVPALCVHRRSCRRSATDAGECRRGRPSYRPPKLERRQRLRVLGLR